MEMTDTPPDTDIKLTITKDTSQDDIEPIKEDIDIRFSDGDTYISNMEIVLRKLRKLRWAYRECAEYYEKVNDNRIYYPSLIISFIIALSPIVNSAGNNNVEIGKWVGYTVAFLGAVNGVLQKYSSKKQYELKAIKFETAAHECDKLITRVSNEIKFPSEEPNLFALNMEDYILKMKDDLKFQVPNFILAKYRMLELEHPGDISSEEIKIGLSSPKKKQILQSRFEKDKYDFEVEDDIKDINRKSKQKITQMSQSNISYNDSNSYYGSPSLQRPIYPSQLRRQKNTSNSGVGIGVGNIKDEVKVHNYTLDDEED